VPAALLQPAVTHCLQHPSSVVWEFLLACYKHLQLARQAQNISQSPDSTASLDLGCVPAPRTGFRHDAVMLEGSRLSSCLLTYTAAGDSYRSRQTAISLVALDQLTDKMGVIVHSAFEALSSHKPTAASLVAACHLALYLTTCANQGYIHQPMSRSFLTQLPSNSALPLWGPATGMTPKDAGSLQSHLQKATSGQMYWLLLPGCFCKWSGSSSLLYSFSNLAGARGWTALFRCQPASLHRRPPPSLTY
jgi:hypothetical protein